MEECLTLNIEEFTSGDLLRPTSWADVRWVRGGKETGSVDYQLRNIGFKEGESVYILTLLSPLIHRDRRIPITQDIHLVTTKLHSGGRRYWFSCPNCLGRVGRDFIFLMMSVISFAEGATISLIWAARTRTSLIGCLFKWASLLQWEGDSLRSIEVWESGVDYLVIFKCDGNFLPELLYL